MKFYIGYISKGGGGKNFSTKSSCLLNFELGNPPMLPSTVFL